MINVIVQKLTVYNFFVKIYDLKKLLQYLLTKFSSKFEPMIYGCLAQCLRPMRYTDIRQIIWIKRI